MNSPAGVPIDRNDTRAAARADSADPSRLDFGQRIKMLRVSRGLTLKDLESRGAISATHVSEIERGRASPTVGALRRIARALGVRPATLLAPTTHSDVTVTRASERGASRIQWGQATLDPVCEATSGGGLGAMIVTLPIASSPALTHRHPGEEWVTVLSGQAEIRIDSDLHVLREGDSLHFRADRVHSYSNPASTLAVLLVASRPRLAL